MNLYQILHQLQRIKKTSDIRLVILELILIEQALIKTIDTQLSPSKITKKLVTDMFTGEPSRWKNAIKYLSLCGIIDFSKWVVTWEFDTSPLTEEEEEPLTPLEKFSWRYGRKFHSSFKAYWQLLINTANWKRYFPEEYFNLLIAEVRKDKFWGKVVTEEMVLRKFLLLEKQFWGKIPKKIGDMEDVVSIF